MINTEIHECQKASMSSDSQSICDKYACALSSSITEMAWVSFLEVNIPSFSNTSQSGEGERTKISLSLCF